MVSRPKGFEFKDFTYLKFIWESPIALESIDSGEILEFMEILGISWESLEFLRNLEFRVKVPFKSDFL